METNQWTRRGPSSIQILSPKYIATLPAGDATDM